MCYYSTLSLTLTCSLSIEAEQKVFPHWKHIFLAFCLASSASVRLGVTVCSMMVVVVVVMVPSSATVSSTVVEVEEDLVSLPPVAPEEAESASAAPLSTSAVPSSEMKLKLLIKALKRYWFRL